MREPRQTPASRAVHFWQAHGHRLTVLLLLCVGIALRCAAFGQIPAGLNQDEASMAYDAYADMTYGMDRNGDHNPIYAVSWGSGQNMLYNYLVRPWIAAFGLTATVVRLPMLLLNCLMLPAFWGLAKACFDRKTALWALFLMAICPWHVMLSRWALESNLAVPLLVFAAYSFTRVQKNPAWFAAGMALAALCAYAYLATAFFLALWIPAMAVGAWVQKTVPKRWLAAGVAIFALLLLPLGAFMAVNVLDLPATRFLGFAIPRLSEMRSANTTVLFGSQPRLAALLKNLLKLGRVLLTMNDGSISNAIPNIGAIYWPLIPFILIGIGAILRRFRKESHTLLLPLAWLAAALMQACIVVVNINRVNVLFPALILCGAVGVRAVAGRFRYLGAGVTAVCLLCTGLFGVTYFQNYATLAKKSFYAGLDNAIVYASAQMEGTVYCTKSVNAPYVFALFGQKTDPALFLDTVQYDDMDAPFRHVQRFDRFVTGIPNPLPQNEAYALVLPVGVALPDELAQVEHETKVFGNYQVMTVP